MLETLQQTMDARQSINQFKNMAVLRSGGGGGGGGGGVTLKEIKRRLLFHFNQIVTTWKDNTLSVEHDTPSGWEMLKCTRVKCLSILEETVHSLLTHVSTHVSGGNNPNKSKRMVALRRYGEQSLVLACAEGMMEQQSYDVAHLYLEQLQQQQGLLINTTQAARIYFQNKFQAAVGASGGTGGTGGGGGTSEELQNIIGMTEHYYDTTVELLQKAKKEKTDGGSTNRVDPEIVKINFLRGEMLDVNLQLSNDGGGGGSGGGGRTRIDEVMTTYEHANSLVSLTIDPSLFWEPMLKYAMYVALEASRGGALLLLRLLVVLINNPSFSLSLYVPLSIP